jgi:hypothetical protein
MVIEAVLDGDLGNRMIRVKQIVAGPMYPVPCEQLHRRDLDDPLIVPEEYLHEACRKEVEVVLSDQVFLSIQAEHLQKGPIAHDELASSVFCEEAYVGKGVEQPEQVGSRFQPLQDSSLETWMAHVPHQFRGRLTHMASLSTYRVPLGPALAIADRFAELAR